MEKLKPVIEWIKSHMMITLMCVLIVAFLACGWYFSGILNEGLVQDINDRKQLFQKIDKATKSSVTLPLTGGEVFTANGTLNPQFIDRLGTISSAMKEDLGKARITALEHNGDPWASDFPHPDFTQRTNANATPTGGKMLLVSESIFPNPPADERETLPDDIYKELIKAYSKMLKDAGAGAPPLTDEVERELASARSNFIQRDLRKGTEADLNQEERAELSETLSRKRIEYYNESASKIRFYGSASAFDLPADPFTTKVQHSLGELYGWHWDWWIAQDIVAAIATANAGTDADDFVPVQHAPVKRLVSLRSLDPVPGVGKASSASSGGNNSNQGRRTARGSRGATSGTNVPAGGTSSGEALPEPLIDMNVAAPKDFATSMTGRQSNALYDVRDVELVLVVETAHLPRVINSLAQENFITITDLSLQPTSAHEAAQYGYMFGHKPVSLVTMRLETIWFRKWTAAWMPQEVRDALGVKSQGTQG